MSRLLYLKKGEEPPAPFELLEYAEPDGGRLHGPSTLAKLRLATLEMKVSGTDAYVPVAFHTGTELSIRRFTANSQDAPLAVRGEGVAGAAGAAGAIVEQLQARMQQLEIASAIVWEVLDYDDSNATLISVPEFKESLLAAYSARRDGSVGRLAFCMLTHKYLPKGTVIAAHLWKRAWSRFCNKVGFDNIDDIRNGLLLFKPIEWAFDNSKLSIVPNTTFSPPTFQAYLQDVSLADVLLIDKLEELRDHGKVKVTDVELEYTRQHMGGMTFGDVHQRNLRSDGRSSPDPFTRVLHFQYKRALRKAAQQGWQQPEGTPPSSHASPGACNVQRMFDSLPHDGSQ